MNFSHEFVERIKDAADRLEREAAELRRVVEHLEGGFDTGDREATPPPHPPDEAPPPTAATYGLKRVRCSGCPERRRCPNILERNRIRKVNKCQECHNAENATRNRLNRAKRKPERPNGAARKRPLQTLKTVRCSGCPERPDCGAKTACLATRREGHLVSIVVDADSLTEEDARVVARLGMLFFRPAEHIHHSDTCQNPTKR